MGRNTRNVGHKVRYVRKKSPSKEMADKIKRGELYTGVMKVQLDLGLAGIKDKPKLMRLPINKEMEKQS